MNISFFKTLTPYFIGNLLLVAITGLILSPIVDNYIVLFSVLVIEYIILILILLHIFERYIKPIQLAAKTVSKLVKGNYRARIHHSSNGAVGVLTNRINSLARNLSELTIHEQMQSEQLSTVIDNTESGLVLIDEKGYIHLVNRKFISIFGKKPKDYIGTLYYDVIENERIHQTVQNTFLYEENVKMSFTHGEGLDKNYIEIVGAPIFNDNAMLKGAVLVLYDITELKKLENMRKDFVANVSHELKTPITSIKGFAETLVEGSAIDEETNNKFLHIIYEESNRLQLLVEDLLILSRLEQDQFQLSVKEITIESLIEDVVPMIQQKAIASDITFHVKADNSLTFEADSERIKQVLLNLLANAISYTPKKGEVTLNIFEEAEYVCFRVQDTGIGIKDSLLPRIFERFYRVDKDRSRNTGGTGLGLAIVKHIVEVHNGRIEVESELNKGSTFTVYLPKQQID